jgi:hypothetical protein
VNSFLTRKESIDTKVPKKAKEWPNSILFEMPLSTGGKPSGKARKHLQDNAGDKFAKD